MKIKEVILEALVDPEERELPQSVPFNLRKMGKRTEKTVRKGGGAYATGTPDPTDPFMYRKKLRQPSNLEMDAYYQYIKFIQPFMDENPFFPKVYNIDIKKDPKGLLKPSYKIEKLMPIRDAENEMEGDLENALANKYLHDPDEWSVLTVITKAITNDSYLEKIKDEKLIEAIQLIRYFFEANPQFVEDLHLGNMMVRFTSVGPQLVFTDPAHDRGESIVGYNVFKGGWPKNPNAIINMEEWQVKEKLDKLYPLIIKEKRIIIREATSVLDPDSDDPIEAKEWNRISEFNGMVIRILDFYTPTEIQLFARNHQKKMNLDDPFTIDMLPNLLAIKFRQFAGTYEDISDLLNKLADKVQGMVI